MHHIETGKKFVAPGLCEAPPYVDHRLSIHVGNPVVSICMEGASRRRFVRMPGGINIVPAGAQSRWLIKTPMHQLHVRVPHESFAFAAQDLGLDPSRVQLDARHQVRDELIEHIGHSLQLENAEGNPNGRLFLDSLGIAFSVRLIRGFSGRAMEAVPRRISLGPPQLARVVEYIDEHLANPLGLQELSVVAGTSVSHFKVAFKRAFGTPVHRYVVERRVERAARLLAAGAPISATAAEAGFAHASHMARWMSRLLRVTPSELRPRSC